MKAKHPKTVLDPYEFMPGYGETAVSVNFINSNCIVDILYDSQSIELQGKLSLKFLSTCYFSMSSFPGVMLTEIDYERADNLGDLVEYQYSDAANKWLKQLPFYHKIKHYSIYFLSANEHLEVFATEFEFQSS